MAGHQPGPVYPYFAPAAQPEIMRAAEKDEQYLKHVCDACHDVLRRCLGARVALLYQDEARLAGRLCYHFLTTGLGLQTLGEEYCDIRQVAGEEGFLPTPLRRCTLVFLHTVFPYLVERLSAQAVARGLALALQRQTAGGGVRNATAETDASEQSDVADLLDSSAETSTSDDGETGIEVRDQRGSRSTSRARQRANLLLLQQQRPSNRWLRGLTENALQLWPVMLPAIKESLLLCARMHLMLFYFEGVYYHLAKRATSIRHIFTSRSLEPRPRYHVLGMFLLIQLGILGGDMWRRLISSALYNSFQFRTAHSLSPSRQGRRGVPVLDEGVSFDAKGNTNGVIDVDVTREVEQQDGDTESAREAEALISSKCPLCLSVREAPTATPCGHVFCWTCIAGWCNEKPECPLCRAPVLHTNLVCVYHSDF